VILNTKHFGEIEIDESQIITFEDGLLGFEHIKRYILIQNPDKEVPFHWLQAVDDPELAFVVTIPFLFKEDYEFDIPDKVIKQLGIEKHEDVVIYSIAVVPEDIKEMTINLQGPLIIHGKNKKGKQIVLDNNAYSLKYRIFKETAEAVQE
jgi:flagellar assembly factor FliW